MRSGILGILLSTTLLACSQAEPPQRTTLTGVITDTMCGATHDMNIEPDAVCVRECVRMDPERWQYALLVDGEIYTLSDQQTPEQYAAERVTITGLVSPATKTIEVESIEPAS